MPLRRDYAYADDFGDDFDQEGEFAERMRKPGVRLSFSGRVLPKTLWGRIAAGSGLVLLAGAGIAALLVVRSFVLHDPHFTVEGSSAIQIAGNSHLTRPQLLSVFGEDVERNIFNIPLVQRRAELESLPWVAHATVMRLLPNQVRVGIVERTPVAFVRQGKEIGLVDANGVLLDMARPVDPDGVGARKAADYSFPVLTGISAADPVSTRAARMKIYMEFVAALDSSGQKISQGLSEVDLSNPEDVRAILPSGGAAGTDVLVHFGDEKFLERYQQYEQHLPEWRRLYPKLASADMRYERQVVLEMQPGSAVPNGTPQAGAGDSTGSDSAKAAVVKPVEKKAEAVAAKPVAAAAVKPVAVKPVAVKAKAPVVVRPVAKARAVASSSTVAAPAHGHLTTAFAVVPAPAGAATKQVPISRPAGKTVATPVSQGAAR
jgi:cell division protein FtsQ